MYSPHLKRDVNTLECIQCGHRGKICEQCHGCRNHCGCQAGQCPNEACSKAGWFQLLPQGRAFTCQFCGSGLRKADVV